MQFRQILEKGNRELSARCNKCSPTCSDSCTLHPVQQGEVSSTEPPVPESSVNGLSPEKSAYFEAVDHYITAVGWALLEINNDGVIEYVTESIKDYINFSRSDLLGKPIYSYLHPGDHSKLSPLLDNISIGFGWAQDDLHQQKRAVKARIRMLIKSPDSATETMEQKQKHFEKYEEVSIIATPMKGK